ncbi:transcriptional regulator [Tenacibaculum holothuriorum]|uniref:Transcriptional regulator n=1 Tax=Tenacibaculum holothuriorum TaxID=1635173 RepID=A0A1Y2PH09_9FLAO|nr:response regulator [Tenacibaculum holothuriorum]OSY89281.1 transcriptional regulator [Tenacibaculum holothuriorum]
MKRILLIEDDITLRENTAELLELSDYEVVTASNGKIGVEKAQIELPDIIICDIMMPEMDGYGVIQELSQNTSTQFIPFIFLSAKTERSDVRKGMDLGADDYITKPFTEDELVSAIESRLAKAAILKEQRQTNFEEKNDENEIRNLSQLKNFFDDNGKLFQYKKSDKVYGEGSNSNYIFLVLSGAIKCYKLDEQGKELTTALYKEDDLFGYTSFTQNIPYQDTAIAIKNTELVGITKQELINILDKNHKVTLDLIELLTDNLTGLKEQLLEMAYSSVHKKTASTILKFAKKINRNINEPIKISRHDLASVAGIATETLIRSMSKLKKEGIIEIEGRNVKILDLEKLQEIQ